MFQRILPICLVAMLCLCACKPSTQPAGAGAGAGATVSNTKTQIFQVKGVIVELKPAESAVRIKHEEIPDYMGAMTMTFDVKSTNELTGLLVGDNVIFRMTVTEKDGWIDHIKKIAVPTNAVAAVPDGRNLPTNSPIQLVRDVQPLNVGDTLPDYHFTNQLGEAVSTSQYRGQAMALTFIFTRCPYPTFCPLMSNNFRDVQDALLKKGNGPANWQLLTLTFDPDYDTPERLKKYSENYKCDPKHWSFLTGKLIDITAIAEQFGMVFWRDPGPGGNISHNLRTVVVDAKGRVQKIYTENKWTAEELADEMVKAAAVK